MNTRGSCPVHVYDAVRDTHQPPAEHAQKGCGTDRNMSRYYKKKKWLILTGADENQAWFQEGRVRTRP